MVRIDALVALAAATAAGACYFLTIALPTLTQHGDPNFPTLCRYGEAEELYKKLAVCPSAVDPKKRVEGFQMRWMALFSAGCC